MIEVILIIVGVLVFIILSTIGWVIGVYNTFKVGQQDIKTQMGNIKTEYQRRGDMFYNLVQSVKSHKKFEKETLIQVTQARSGNFGSTNKETIKKMSKMDSAFARLLVVFERYPTLQSSQHYTKLMDEIRITEDRINVARTDYNEIVGDFNKMVVTFPRNILAGMFKINTEAYFENEEETTKAPKIELD